MTLIEFIDAMGKHQIVGKLTAGLVICATAYTLLWNPNPEIFHNGSKDIMLLILGGATVLLFK